MPNQVVIEAKQREDLGKNACRRLRRAGRIPAVVYGLDEGAKPLSVDPGEVQDILQSEAGENTLFGLKIGAGPLAGQFMIKDHQIDPVSEHLIHADFMRVAMDRAIRVHVAVHTVGTAVGVKVQGGILDHPLREVEVECLPGDIPERIEIDISDLELGKSVRVADLKVPPEVRVITDPSMPIVAVVAPAVEKVEEPAAEAEAEAPTEPELIKKGKEESGEAEAAPRDGADKGGKAEKE